MRGSAFTLSTITMLAFASVAATADWRLADVPGQWPAGRGARRFAWYRCFVKVPAAWRGESLTLELGRIDDCDETFFNGTRVGSTGRMPPRPRSATNTLRRYRVPARLVRFGDFNMIAVRVYNDRRRAGIIGGPLVLSSRKGALSLEGQWLFQPGDSPDWARWPADETERKKMAEDYLSAAKPPVGARVPMIHPKAEAPEGNLVLWYRRPARLWLEALPVGNGRLGAMVFGGVPRERIQLNEDTLWAGHPVGRDKVGAHKRLAEIRRLFFEGKYAEGEALFQQVFMGQRIAPRSFQTLGDLNIAFHHEGDITDYQRALDLRTAVARTTYRVGGANFTREVFASPTDQVLVVRVESDKPGQVSLDATLSRPENATVRPAAPNRLVMTGQADKGKPTEGVKFEAHVVALAEGGRVAADASGLHLEGADAATLLIAAATTYNHDETTRPCQEAIAAASRKNYRQLREAAIADHRRLFDRVSLDLGRSEAAKRPTDERLEAFKKGATDPHLVALYFQFGRYLLIGCSRPRCMPSNLQGLWNEHINAPWNCDYHININVQMNYWPAEPTNLPECHEPFFDLIDNLRPRGRKTARDVYGCRGFVAHHTTDAWWFTSPVGRTGYGAWPMGAAWCTRHLWEHYLFTGDRGFLARRAWPAIKEAAEFLLDFLCEDPKTGKLVSGPSTSPENRFRTPDGKVAHLSMGCAMDQEIIWDTLANVLDAAKVLGIEDGFVREVRAKLSRLALPKIGSDGRLMEWAEELEEPEPGHRHMSHLYGLYPAWQFTPTTPKYFAAARKSLEYRLAHGGGHTGWSRAWIINFWARLLDAEKAHENVLALLRKSTNPDLLDNHPPFQIDGNFGGCAGIAEMLLQSHLPAGQDPLEREIHLLPALPKAWANGSVEGLCARGGFVVDMTWQDGRIAKATVFSKLGTTCHVRADAPLSVACDGKPVKAIHPEENLTVFPTSKGKTYVLSRPPE